MGEAKTGRLYALLAIRLQYDALGKQGHGCSLWRCVRRGQGRRRYREHLLQRSVCCSNAATCELTDRFAYNPAGNGRWLSLNLKKKKKAGGRRKKKVVQQVRETPEADNDDEEAMDEEGEEDDEDAKAGPQPELVEERPPTPEEDEEDADDPAKTVPLTRYNAMMAIVKNTLFMYVPLGSKMKQAYAQLRRNL